MRNLLNPDSPVLMFITRLVYAVWLNILWFVCSIPLITIGASTTALFTVTLKMARNEEGNITSQFFKAFADNFKFSTKVWLILMAVLAVLAVDGYALNRLRYTGAVWTILFAFWIVASVMFFCILMYIFPLMAHFENTVGAMLKNALFISIRYLICTAAMLAIYFIMLLIIVRFFTPAVIFGEGVCAFLCSFLLNGVLKACEGPDAHKEEGSEEDAAESPEGASEGEPEGVSADGFSERVSEGVSADGLSRGQIDRVTNEEQT